MNARLWALLAAVVMAATGVGCQAIHSFDASREFNPKGISVSGNVGAGLAMRDRDGDGSKDPVKLEKVLVPDARANIRVAATDFLMVGVDPLPPSVGVNIAWRYYPREDRVTSLTIQPSFNYLVWPHQKIYSIELPIAVAHHLRKWLLVYGGPKAVYQSGVLRPDNRLPQRIWMSGVPDRADQDFHFLGLFAGFAMGGLHAQLSPEIDFFYDVSTGEQVLLAGVGLRLAL